MDHLSDSFDSLAAGLRGWGRKQHSFAACDCAGCFGASVNNQAADNGAMMFDLRFADRIGFCGWLETKDLTR
jgi:hypothetical protein